MSTPTVPDLTAVVARQRQQLAADFEAMHDAQFAAAAAGHPELLEQAHNWLDADDDTAWPLPGVAHPKTAGGTS